MQAESGFEQNFGRRLRDELDAMEIKVPLNLPALRGRRSWFGYGLVRPLVLATAATIAIMVMASAVTGSTNPGVWIKPSAWIRTIGIAAPSPTPKAEPKENSSPSSEPEKSAQPNSPEHESGGTSTPSDYQGKSNQSDDRSATPAALPPGGHDD
ncbi:MAG TPA: hypothetical protein VND96_13210 [Candidatus Micrarchaeaceae archaeon]|nr:hypothetical protein [Candidatus Micrarchaeaceae archaeon]